MASFGYTESGVGLFRTAPTEIRLPVGIDLSECFCAMHVAVEHSIPHARGCAGKGVSSFPPLKSSGLGVHRHCDASVGQRKVDLELARLASGVSVSLGSYGGVVGSGLDLVRAFPPHAAAEFKAGYCWMPAIEGNARATAARLVPPYPLVVDVIRLVFLLGRKRMKPLVTELVGDLKLHVISRGDKGMFDRGGVMFVQHLLDMVELHGVRVRIGSPLSDWMDENDVPFYDRDNDDELIVTSVAVSLVSSSDRARLRGWALIGDRAMKLALAVAGLESRISVGDLQDIETRSQSDVAFALALSSSSLAHIVNVGNGVSLASARVGGSICEAIAGLVYERGGLHAVVCYMRVLGLLGGGLVGGVTIDWSRIK